MKDEMVIEQQRKEIDYLDREVKDLRAIRTKLEEIILDLRRKLRKKLNV